MAIIMSLQLIIKSPQSLMLRYIKPSSCKIKFLFWSFQNVIPEKDYEFEILLT
jgi:hypothetical protein